MAVSIIIVAVVLSQARKGSTELEPAAEPTLAPSTAPTTAPSSSPTGALDDFALSLPHCTQQSLDDPLSAQSLSLDCLSKHPESLNMTGWRKQQLFALVTFQCSFEGESWPQKIKDDWKIHAKNECDWFSSDSGRFVEDGTLGFDN